MTVSASPMTEPCPICEEGTATLVISDQEIMRGSGDDQRIVTVLLPVWSCSSCELEYLDEDGERAIDQADGRLTAGVVKLIRKNAGLTQAEFAKQLNVGIASIKRWELGKVVRNASADEMIRRFAAEETDNSGLSEEDHLAVLAALNVTAIRKLEDDVAHYSGGESSGNLEVLRMKALAWDAITALLIGDH